MEFSDPETAMTQPTHTSLHDAMTRLAQALEEYTHLALAMQHAAEQMSKHASRLSQTATQIGDNLERPPAPAGQSA